MRRSDKEIKDKKTLELILKKAQFCRIALCDKGKPYIVPMNFGYKDNSLYLHSAKEGRKIEILQENNSICFEMDMKTELVRSKKPCQWGMKYYSIIGNGEVSLIKNLQEKIKALNIIMEKYTPNQVFQYDKDKVEAIHILKVEIHDLTGKLSGY